MRTTTSLRVELYRKCRLVEISDTLTSAVIGIYIKHLCFTLRERIVLYCISMVL